MATTALADQYAANLRGVLGNPGDVMRARRACAERELSGGRAADGAAAKGRPT